MSAADEYARSLCKYCSSLCDGWLRHEQYSSDDPLKYANTSICLQAVGYKYEDERVLQALEAISKLLPLRS